MIHFKIYLKMLCVWTLEDPKGPAGGSPKWSYNFKTIGFFHPS